METTSWLCLMTLTEFPLQNKPKLKRTTNLLSYLQINTKQRSIDKEVYYLGEASLIRD